MYFLVSHVVFQKGVSIFGPIHVVDDFLKLKKQPVIKIFAPLTTQGEYLYQNANDKIISKQVTKNEKLKYLSDVFFILKCLFNRPPKEEDTVIAADPLCVFPFVFFKLLFDFKLIYYTADYADKRFESTLLNGIYSFLDRLALLVADENWCVSNRIYNIRLEQGYSRKAKFVPNTNLSHTQPTTQKQSYQNKLLYVGRMEKNMAIDLLLNYCLKYAKKEKWQLSLIGSGTQDTFIQEFITKNKLSKVITFHGPKENSFVQEMIKKHGIGIALYKDSKNWNKYGDSMKIREYQACGLPVITTQIPSNAEEIVEYKAGIVLNSSELTETTLKESIKALQKNYRTFSQNTSKVAQKNSKKELLEGLLDL